MIRIFLIVILAFEFSVNAYSQGRKPSIMVVPMDIWCQERGFWEVLENQGEIEGRPQYQQAIQDSRELVLVISEINNLFKDRGYGLKDLATSIKSNARRNARNMLLTSKNNSSLSVSPLDELNRQVKADIVVEVDWSINTVGPKHSITYNIRAIDSYTSKQIAGAQGTGKPQYTNELPVLLREAVVSNMDNFLYRLQTHFDDCIENGREVVIEVGVFDDGSGKDLELEYDGYELREIIEKWLSENTVNNQYTMVESTENTMLFEGVRIQMLKDNGQPLDASGFLNELRRFLKSKYAIESKNVSPSLGYAQIVIGEK
jgi:hypothetical protein